jgi:hypothetical protein
MMTTVAAAQPSAADAYALGREPGESARLQRQSEELRPDSAALLDRVSLGPGQAAIDLGWTAPSGPTSTIDRPGNAPAVLPRLGPQTASSAAMSTVVRTHRRKLAVARVRQIAHR